MISHYEEEFAKAQEKFNNLIQLITTDWRKFEIHKVEKNLFQDLLLLGRNLLQLNIAARGTGKADYDGETPYHSEKEWNYISIFGDIPIGRAYFWEEGLGKGIYPLNGVLNLPARHHSYVLQK